MNGVKYLLDTNSILGMLSLDTALQVLMRDTRYAIRAVSLDCPNKVVASEDRVGFQFCGLSVCV
jgi:hypothetical protein